MRSSIRMFSFLCSTKTCAIAPSCWKNFAHVFTHTHSINIRVLALSCTEYLLVRVADLVDMIGLKKTNRNALGKWYIEKPLLLTLALAFPVEWKLFMPCYWYNQSVVFVVDAAKLFHRFFSVRLSILSFFWFWVLLCCLIVFFSFWFFVENKWADKMVMNTQMRNV